MSRRREWPLQQPCTHSGCRERSNYIFDTKRELDEHRKMFPTWTCTRHSRPEEVLSTENPERTTVLIATDRKIQGWLFWVPESGGGLSNGFSDGPGFKAWAKDFPEGTRLVVTARIELPERVAGAIDHEEECHG